MSPRYQNYVFSVKYIFTICANLISQKRLHCSRVGCIIDYSLRGIVMDLMTAKEASELWGISQRRVQVLCDNGRVSGAERLGNDMWVIPIGTPKPLDGRTKTAKQEHHSVAISRDIEHLIGEVNGTMAIEGMPLTDEDKARLRVVLRGEVTADEMVLRLIAKHRRSENVGRV
jgi:hypothetical protein